MSGIGRIAIVGAGWAGLACAVELAAAGRRVCIFEAGRQPGGRARGVELDGRRLDNGQHLIVGAYRETLRLLARVGSDPATVFRRLPLALRFPGDFELTLPRLPAPLNLAAGLLTARGARLGEKLAAARFMRRLQADGYRVAPDTSVARWLDRHRQHGALRRRLWEPLCLAALTTTPEHASAQVFATVLRDSLGGASGATDMLLPCCDLGALFPEPALRFVVAHGGEARLAHRVAHIERAGNGWRIGDEDFSDLVLATAPQHLGKLLAGRPAHEPLLRSVADYRYEAIATAYFAFPEDFRLPCPLLGLPGPFAQWAFDRAASGGNPGVIAVVISAGGEWQTLADDALLAALKRELAAALGPLPAARWQRVIREHRAAFACRPNMTRPGCETAERGLWLAGDHCHADYPATLEGAVRSGVTAARAILA